MTLGIVLYGPPAAGKDTVTRALGLLNPKYQLFQRLKVGGGRTQGYRMASEADITALKESGDIVWENRRYGSSYYVDRIALSNELTRCVPVVHLGQVEAIAAIRSAVAGAKWVVVSVWCPREVAEERIIGRNTGDTAERLRVWDATELISADVAINTAKVSASQAAQIIDRSVRERVSAPPPAAGI